MTACNKILLHEELLQIHLERKIIPIQKWAKNTTRDFTKKKYKRQKNHMKKCSDLVTKKSKLKRGYVFLTIKLENVLFQIHNQCWQVKNAGTVYFGITLLESLFYQ